MHSIALSKAFQTMCLAWIFLLGQNWPILIRNHELLLLYIHCTCNTRYSPLWENRRTDLMDDHESPSYYQQYLNTHTHIVTHTHTHTHSHTTYQHVVFQMTQKIWHFPTIQWKCFPIFLFFTYMTNYRARDSVPCDIIIIITKLVLIQSI